MKIKTKAVDLAGRYLAKKGYHLQKTGTMERVDRIEKPLDVLALAAFDLMQRRGERLSFVQIGANDGVRYDPIRPFAERFGWTGLLVEPQPSVFKALQENYAAFEGMRFECAAIGAKCGQLTLHGFDPDAPDARHMSGVASVDRHVVEHNIHNHRAPMHTFIVPLLTPTALLEKHGIGEFDVLQIDAEGMDAEILFAFDFERYQPALIHFEHSGLEPLVRGRLYEYLEKYGYSLAQGPRDDRGVTIDTVCYRSNFETPYIAPSKLTASQQPSR